MKQLAAHGWPLNETELHNLLGALAGRREGGPVQLQQLLPLLERGATTETDRRRDKDRIVDALWRNGFNRIRPTENSGIPSKTPPHNQHHFGSTGSGPAPLSAPAGRATSRQRHASGLRG